MTTPYVTGTVSVTAGSAVVTGQGTAWQTALVAGGLFGLDSSNGNPVPILSVDSNTQLTLAKPWRGATAADQGYWIIRDTAYLQQLSVNAQALATYIQRLDNAALAALAGLAPAADKLAYFTGGATALLTDIKAKGRDILGSATMVELLGKLGPVNGGVLSPRPALADVGLIDGDFNSINVPGTYTISGNWLNGSSGAASASYGGILVVYGRVTNNGFFQLHYQGDNNVWWRFTSSTGGTAWPNPWRKMPVEVLGTVSQSGGVPTGAIIERGSNANGDYVRFADGTQICFGAFNLTSTDIGGAGNFRRAVTFPVAFSASPAFNVVIGYQSENAVSFNNTLRYAAERFPSVSGSALLVQATGAFTTTAQGMWNAIGRWF